MKNIVLPALVITILLGACSSAYKATSTPDDVYYSPAPAMKASSQERYEDYTSNSEDNYLRMKVRNRYQWNGIDDYNYWNDSRYDFGYSCTPSRQVLLYPNYGFGFGNMFYYTSWNSWYSPYSTIVYYKNPNVYYGTTSKTNLTGYRNGNYNNTNRKSSFSSLLSKAFINTNNNSSYNSNNNINNNPSRTFNSGTTQSNNAGGRSGGYNSSGSSSGSNRPPRN